MDAKQVWAGRIIGALVILFLLVDAGGKLVAPASMIANSPPIGLPADPGFYRMLALILLPCVLLHSWPRTAPLGAVLITGYLGGAIACHLRVGSPIFTHTLFGVYVGVLLWAGLWLRDARVRALI